MQRLSSLCVSLWNSIASQNFGIALKKYTKAPMFTDKVEIQKWWEDIADNIF